KALRSAASTTASAPTSSTMQVAWSLVRPKSWRRSTAWVVGPDVSGSEPSLLEHDAATGTSETTSIDSAAADRVRVGTNTSSRGTAGCGAGTLASSRSPSPDRRTPPDRRGGGSLKLRWLVRSTELGGHEYTVSKGFRAGP